MVRLKEHDPLDPVLALASPLRLSPRNLALTPASGLYRKLLGMRVGGSLEDPALLVW